MHDAADPGAAAEFGEAFVAPEVEDVRAYVWALDEDGTGATLRLAAARRLFAACGVVSPAGTVLVAADAVSPVGGRAATAGAGVPGEAAGLPSLLPQSAYARLSAAGDHRSHGEVVENLLSDGREPWNKWLHPGRVLRSWIQADLAGPRPWVLSGYEVMSAGDCPHRDPASWELRGRKADGGDWVSLHTVTTCPFVGRLQWVRVRPRDASRITCRLCQPRGYCLASDSTHCRQEPPLSTPYGSRSTVCVLPATAAS